MSGLLSLLSVFGALGLVVFVLPTIVAAWKRHPWFWIIAAVNFGGGILLELLFGRIFTGLGWLAAVVLVLWPAERSDNDLRVRSTAAHPVAAIPQQQYDVAKAEALEPGLPRATKTCPDCAATVPADAGICRACFHRFEIEPDIA